MAIFISKGTTQLQKLLIFCGFSFLSFCGTWIGNPDRNSKQEYTAVDLLIMDNTFSSNSRQVDVTGKDGSSIGTAIVDNAFVSIEEIEVKSAPDSEDENEFDGSFLVDLINNIITPKPEKIELLSGLYKSVELDLNVFKSIEGDSIADGSTIFMSGRFIDNFGTEKDFVFRYRSKVEVFLDNDGKGFDLTKGTGTILISFNSKDWLNFSGNNYDFADIKNPAIVLDSGEIALSGDKALQSLENRILQNIDATIDDDVGDVLEDDDVDDD